MYLSSHITPISVNDSRNTGVAYPLGGAKVVIINVNLGF